MNSRSHQPPASSPVGSTAPVVLWWSRSGHDYSRNRVMRSAFRSLGWSIQDFRPWLSRVGHVEARLQRLTTPDLIWVPCFRQRDAGAAARFADQVNVPAVFDPLISAFDKQVNERRKFSAESRRGRSLRSWETRMFRRFDRLIADTQAHADYFSATFEVPPSGVDVVPVGAEESVFQLQPVNSSPRNPIRLLFYGSFIGLQGPRLIAEAARRESRFAWTMLGDGPLRQDCEHIASGLHYVTFQPWIPYPELPGRIAEADFVLGIFGTSGKAASVIPNKVYQALACGRPVITQRSEAYPQALLQLPSEQSGMFWTTAGEPDSLLEAVDKATRSPVAHTELCAAARRTYDTFFSRSTVVQALRSVLTRCGCQC